MSGHKNGHQIGNGNGAPKKAWDLKNDGILWRKVVERSTKTFEKQANTFVAQLQDSVQPTDALQGLLLDRMAASYLRKQLLLDMESMAGLAKRSKVLGGSPSAEQWEKPTSLTIELPIGGLLSPEVVRYEALLDQGFHRDLMLLLKLKEVAQLSEKAEKDSRAPEQVVIGASNSIIDQL